MQHQQDSVSVDALVKGIKEIVEVVLKKDEGNAEAIRTKDEQQKSIGKLFAKASDNASEAEAAAASATIEGR
ncbi:Borrelia lipoprotein-containing protein (plasmid) [Borrelia crocidurae str. Achema]|uniref:Variable large protein n=1 Tax=Borrelia crocidurae (strain Achema) TaxID=1155096 RepID=I0FFI2_BORCA|nr:Borrelia lipoprotein-containing protein [Borrelia crocidurae str. Achema]